MSATTTANTGQAPAKSKKLFVIGAVVALLVIVGAAVALFLVNQSRHHEEDEGASSKATVVVPTFLPMENMVVNLADPGGDRFAQVGITLELQDEKTAGLVKQYMPSIRNGVLMLISQRTSDELLQREGKEKLAADILVEVSRPLGFKAGSTARAREESAEESDDEDRPRRRQSPVRRVLFSSFIIQ